MNTVKYNGLECEVSIDGNDIELFSIAEGCGRTFMLIGAGTKIHQKAVDQVSYQDRDEDGYYWTYDDSSVDEWIDENIVEFVDLWNGEVLEVTENLN